MRRSNRLIDWAVTSLSLEGKDWDSNLEPFKSNTVLPPFSHHCDISSKKAVLRGRNVVEMGPGYSLHALAYYSENEKLI